MIIFPLSAVLPFFADVPGPCSLLGRVFAVRLVLTGPAPCELVDAKICLTSRIFVKLPSGSMFCSTQDLELVRPEVFHSTFHCQDVSPTHVSTATFCNMCHCPSVGTGLVLAIRIDGKAHH